MSEIEQKIREIQEKARTEILKAGGLDSHPDLRHEIHEGCDA